MKLNPKFFKISRSYLSNYTQKWYNLEVGDWKKKRKQMKINEGWIVMYKWTYQTEIGAITIGADDDSIIYLKNHDTCVGEFKETELICKAYSQLAEYLLGKRRDFDLPLEPKGTEFQQKIWWASCEIPYGETITYAELAEMTGRPKKAARAAGAANGQNPIYIVIPCHRVIGSNGSLTGYGGGLDMKEKLLKLEGVEF